MHFSNERRTFLRLLLTRDMDERTEYTQTCTSVMNAESGTWHQDVSSDEYRLKESDTDKNK